MKNLYIITGTVTDGDKFLQEQMLYEHERTYVVVQFFTNSTLKTHAIPTGGVVTITGSPVEGTWLSMANGTFNAVDTYSLSRTLPNATGPCTSVKINLNGITGATHFRAIITRYV